MQDELSELVSNHNIKGHQAAITIKALRPITYIEPSKPTFKDEASRDLSEIKQNLELYKYEEFLKKLDSHRLWTMH